MLKSILALAAIVATTATAGATTFRPGRYVEKTEIALMFTRDARDCRHNYQGRYQGGLCYVSVANTLDLKADHSISVEIVGFNLHECSYDGKLSPNGDTLSVIERAPDQGQCEIVLSHGHASDEVNLHSTGEYCQNFCGANVTLDMTDAKLAR